MKYFHLKSQLAALLLLCSTIATAHDFEVDGIFYYILSSSDKTVAVTYKGSYHYSYSNEYSGAVTIPASVSYNGTTYSVTTIGNYAFMWCENLESVTIPNSVTTIGNYAFESCSSLASVTIPNSVTTIGYNAFEDCSSLTSVTIPNSVTTIENLTFNRCSNLKSITIPNSVTTIGESAFYGCTSLESVTIPNSVTTIEYSAFYGCTSLESVTIPNSVTNIRYEAFRYCTSLTSVTIPNSVTNIGNSAFDNCSSLTSITSLIPAENLFALAISTFNYVNKETGTLYVPAGAKETYAATKGWNEFTNIVELEPTEEPIFGDISGDNVVNVGDITTIAAMILDASLISDAADINDDDKVNVGDVTSLVGIILGTNNAPARVAANRSADAPVVSAEFDEDNNMYINVSNPDYPFTAAQFDLSFEGGISIVNDGEYYDVFLGSRTTSRNHSAPECAVQPDGSLRVVILSLKNKVFNGTEGDVATVSLDLTGVADGSYSYSIKNIVLSDPQSVMEYPADVEAWVNVAGGVTGINSISADGENANEAIYDLSGRKVANPVKGGIYIKGGKKVIM